MATFLDIGLAQHFAPIFPILFVFVVVFALLEKSKILGENKGLNSLIALSVAIMLLFVPGLIQVINIMAPWFVVLFILVLLFLLLLMTMGTKWDSIAKVAGSWGTIHWFMLVIAIIIFVGSLSAVYGKALLPYSAEPGQVNVSTSEDTSTDTGNFNTNVGRVIFHPKTIGMVFILMVGALTIKLLADTKT